MNKGHPISKTNEIVIRFDLNVRYVAYLLINTIQFPLNFQTFHLLLCCSMYGFQFGLIVFGDRIQFRSNSFDFVQHLVFFFLVDDAEINEELVE